jgi:hypothetical protein
MNRCCYPPDNWYSEDFPAFSSTNGVRKSPPMGSGIRIDNCIGVRPGMDKWHEPVLDEGADFLDWVEKTLRLNSRVMADEYHFEAVVKMTTSPKDRVTLIHHTTADEIHVNVDTIFQRSSSTYVSWSFLYVLSRAAIRFKLKPVALGQGGFSAAPAALIALFKEYDRTINAVAKKKLEKKLVQAQRVANLFIKNVYRYNKKKDKYDADAYGYIGKAFVGLDKNFIQSFKKAWSCGCMMEKFTKSVKRGRTEVTDQLWKVTTPPLFKQMREDIQSKRATHQILNPVVIKEKNFRSVVSGMIEVVFGTVSVWDQIEIPYIVDTDGKDDAIQRERFNTALCLLQLGIGSRSRGIIAVNQIEQLDSVVACDLALMNSLDIHSALRVKYMTKDKPLEWKLYKTYKRASEFDSDYTRKDAVDAVNSASCVDFIDKPFQYYLFDPVLHGASMGVVVDPDRCYHSENKHPREIYMQLFKTCRDYVHAKHINTVRWEQYSTGGRDIWVVSECDRLSSGMHLIFRSIYPGMKLICQKYLKHPDLHMDSFSTHELRRLYVCYSFEFFGRGNTKEIAYAQYVLRHSSLTSTVFYTTLQFDMCTVVANGKRKRVQDDVVTQTKKVKHDSVRFKVVKNVNV